MAGWNEWVPGTNMTLTEVLDALKSARVGLDVKDKLYWSFYKMMELAIKEGNANFDVAKAAGAFKDLASRLDASDSQLSSATAQLAQTASDLDAKKIDKGRSAVMADDLSQEVKTMMTGGSVAVVEENTVDDIHLKKRAVTTITTRNPIVKILHRNNVVINFETNKVTLSRPLMVFQERGPYRAVEVDESVSIPDIMGDTDYITYALYVDIDSPAGSRLKIGRMEELVGTPYVLSRMYQKRVLDNINGIQVINESGEEEYQLKLPSGFSIEENRFDWVTNKFVIPSELYLLTGIDYSISATNFNYNKFRDDNRLAFELTGVTKTDTFKGTANISSPLPVDLNTYIGGMYDNKTTDVIYKDLKLSFASPENKSNKNPTILCLGDSMTSANMPPLIKYWLNHFGFSPTFIGTLDNGHNNWGYPVNVETEKGEGRGGWRLSDYIGTDKIEENPFINPETQEFDFTYYMNNNNFVDVDYIVIMLGTNDLLVDMDESEILRLAEDFNIMINSIHEFNPNIKIGLNPPIQSNNLNFSKKATQFTEKMISLFDNTQPNVYVLGNYLATGKLSGKSMGSNATVEKTPVDAFNNSFRTGISVNVHDGGPNQYVNSLWSASWIINQSE